MSSKIAAKSRQELPRAAQGPPRRAPGRPGTGAGMTLEAPRPLWLPEAPKGPPRGTKEASKKPPERARWDQDWSRQDHSGHDKRRPQKTKTRETKTREDQSDRSQHKIRQDKTRGRTTRGEQRGEVYAPKRRCFPTRFRKRTKGLSDPRRPQPLEPSTTYTGPL